MGVVMSDRRLELPRTMSDATRRSIGCVLDAYGVTWADIVRPERRHCWNAPRRAVYWLLHCKGWSYPQIGRLCQRDHTSIIYHVRKANPHASAR